jgi:hypothetical protein
MQLSTSALRLTHFAFIVVTMKAWQTLKHFHSTNK